MTHADEAMGLVAYCVTMRGGALPVRDDDPATCWVELQPAGLVAFQWRPEDGALHVLAEVGELPDWLRADRAGADGPEDDVDHEEDPDLPDGDDAEAPIEFAQTAEGGWTLHVDDVDRTVTLDLRVSSPMLFPDAFSGCLDAYLAQYATWRDVFDAGSAAHAPAGRSTRTTSETA